MIVPVILSGGAGTRLWPVSREDHPKPFMRLPDGQSLLLKTYLRAAELVDGSGEIVTVTNREHYFESKDHFAEAKLLACRARYLLEPQGRNTAPALAVAALTLAAEYGDDVVLVVMAADHLIHDLAGFKAATEHAVQLARRGYLATYGVRPTAPETGFGYIEAGTPLDDLGGCQAQRFVEKPDRVTAQEYIDSGRFLWNSGMFCFTAGVLLRELQMHAPELFELARTCLEQSELSAHGGLVHELQASSFAALPDISIDFAVMECSSRVAVVPAQFDWSDIGSWKALRELVPPDAESNRAQGPAIFIDSHNTYVQSQGRLVATVGVADLIVVETADAVLVAHADRAQDVRLVAKRLKQENNEAYRLHRTVSRPWGTYTVLEQGLRFKIKRIVVKPGAALSLQMHHHRSEHWIVVQGMAKVVNGGEPRLINSNESTFIPAGHKHRLENPGVIDLVMIEVQSGEYLGEDDIVRFEDQYGRVV